MSHNYSIRKLNSEDEKYILKIQSSNNYGEKYYGERHNDWLGKAILDIRKGIRVAFAAFIDSKIQNLYNELEEVDIVGLVITSKLTNSNSRVELKSFMVDKKAIKVLGKILQTNPEKANRFFVQNETLLIRKEILNEFERYCLVEKLQLIEVDVPTKNEKLLADIQSLGFNRGSLPNLLSNSSDDTTMKYTKIL